MMPVNAFGIGWGLAAFGIIHLAIKVNAASAYLAAAALGIYVFLYTPLKRRSSTNTLLGGIPGAIPPMIGWTAVAHLEGGGWLDGRSWYLFALLFLWQMPHFVAISWMVREQYEGAGYVMWSNGDLSGKKTGWIAIGFSLLLVLFSPLGLLLGYAGTTWAVGGALAALVMLWLAWKFMRGGAEPAATKLFLFTLLHLPLALTMLAIGWNSM